MDRYAVIMAGGMGRRLWPLSRAAKPKQFVDLLGGGALLASTIQRLEGAFDPARILVVGLGCHRELLLAHGEAKLPSENIILEPLGKNTAASIALSALHACRKSGSEKGSEGNDALICILPADHYIGDGDAFRAVLRKGLTAAESMDHIITIGIPPSHAATGYGYICVGDPAPGIAGAWRASAFIEKPDAARAQKLLDAGACFWNAGIFIAKASVMLAKIRRFLPDLYEKTVRAYHLMQSGQDDEAVSQVYESIEAISIDVGVMEKCEDILVIPGTFPWSDVGGYQAIRDVVPKDENGNAVLAGTLLADRAKGLVVHSSGKPIVVSGLEDLVIVDMEDVLYIGKVGDADVAKNMPKLLSDAGRRDLE